jgi:hypothetical protein
MNAHQKDRAKARQRYETRKEHPQTTKRRKMKNKTANQPSTCKIEREEKEKIVNSHHSRKGMSAIKTQ